MVRVRFAPSPTGKLHLGSARTAIFNWLYARHTGGKFILRIEDTDLSRSDNSYTESIIKDMRWMGLEYDEYYTQSGRFAVYREYTNRLLDENRAYYCICEREDIAARYSLKETAGEALKYDAFCRGRTVKPSGSYVIRLNIGEERKITFKDSIKGKITVNTGELDDFVIQKSDGTPTYNFAVVIDDALMAISHIIRGEDHITNTAKQIILYELLGFQLPIFAHLPLVMDKDRTPLSKRKGSINIESYRASGILPEALLNAIARLGWSHGNDEILSVDQMIDFFDIDRINKSAAVYDEEKMIWVNGKHMKSLSDSILKKHFEEFLEEAHLDKTGKMKNSDWLISAIGILKGRHTSLNSLFQEIRFFAEAETAEKFQIEDNAAGQLDSLLKNPDLMKSYSEARNIILSIQDFQNLSGLEHDLREISERNSVKFGDLIQVLRIIITGRTSSPDILSVIKLTGENVRERLNLSL